MKKLVSLLICTVMVLSAFSVSFVVGAADNPTTYTSGDYTYVLSSDNTAEITKYKGKDSVVTVPSQLDGYTVTSIVKPSFYACTKITEMVIPNTVTNIGDNVFLSCENLESITLPDSLVSIGAYAFAKCLSLESIEIPDSVESIGSYLLYNCESMESIVVDSNNKFYDSRNNCNAIIEKATDTLIVGCSNTIIPDTVKHLGEGALASYRYDTIEIPDSVTSIGKYAFGYCSNLTSITIPPYVTSISEYAFSGCYNLQDINLPDSVSSIGRFAFGNCQSIESIKIPPLVTKIEDGTFQGCLGLKKVEMSDAVTYISCRAFVFCKSLETVVIPNPECKIVLVPQDTYSAIPQTAIIYGVDNSSAEEFAKEYKYKFDLICKLDGYEHNEILIKGLKATCYNDGYTDYTICKDCSEYGVKPVRIPMLEHHLVPDNNYLAPTCDKDGHTMSYSCSICYYVIEPSQVIPATGHNCVKLEGKPATEDGPGLTEGLVCETCGCVLKPQVEMVIGDVDGDGRISIKDATTLQQHLVGSCTLSTNALSVSDTDKDTEISVLDATFIQKYLLKIIEKF